MQGASDETPIGYSPVTFGVKCRCFLADLEAFSHNPADGSFAPLAFQPSANAKCLNQRFLSY